MKNIFLKLLAFIKNNIYLVLPIFVFFIVFTTINYCCPQAGDDVFFANAFDDIPGGFNLVNINNFIVNRYYTWSGRLPIEFLAILFCRVPNIFRIANAIVGTLIVYIVFKILRSKSIIVNLFIVCLCFTINIDLISGAGLIATSLNYLWPALCFMTVIFCASIYIIDKKRPSVAMIILSCVLLALYGIWLESLAATLIVLSLILCIYWAISNKKINFYFLFIFSLSLGMVIYAFLVPGNAARTTAETATWYPEFANFSFFDKISLCLISSYRDYVGLIPNQHNYINLFSVPLFILIIVSVFLSTKNKVLRINAVLLILNISLSIGIFNPFTLYHNTGILSFFKIHFCNPSAFGSLVSICFYVHILIALFFTFKSETINVFVLIIFIAGTCSKASIGFSPTVWASGYRTATLLVVCTLLLTGYYSMQLPTFFKEKNPTDGL